MTMRYPFATLLLIACGTALAQSERPERAAAGRITLVDRVVAVVNKEVITQYELAARMNRVLKDLQRRGTSLPERGEIERQVLERLIAEKVQLQFARETGLRVDDLELDRTVNRVAEGNKLSLTEFRKTLERDEIGFDKFREELRNEILVTRLREREVTSKITVSEGEIENFLLEQSGRKDAAAEYSIAHILVRVPEQASPEQLEARRARAEEALKRLKDGADFAQLAAAYSDAPDALQGGVMGWRSQERLPELFVEALAKLRAGEASNVLRSPAGFHVLKLVDLRGAPRTCPPSAGASRRARRSWTGRATRPTRNGCASCAIAPTSSCGSKSGERTVDARSPENGHRSHLGGAGGNRPGYLPGACAAQLFRPHRGARGPGDARGPRPPAWARPAAERPRGQRDAGFDCVPARPARFPLSCRQA